MSSAPGGGVDNSPRPSELHLPEFQIWSVKLPLVNECQLYSRASSQSFETLKISNRGHQHKHRFTSSTSVLN